MSKGVRQAAREGGAKVHLASGAIGGFDVLQTVSLMAQAQNLPETAGIETHTGARGFRNTPVWAAHPADASTEKTTVFTGNAKEAIATFPRRVNVAVATSLATTGPDVTGVTMHSVPNWVWSNDHRDYGRNRRRKKQSWISAQAQARLQAGASWCCCATSPLQSFSIDGRTGTCLTNWLPSSRVSLDSLCGRGAASLCPRGCSVRRRAERRP